MGIIKIKALLKVLSNVLLRIAKTYFFRNVIFELNSTTNEAKE